MLLIAVVATVLPVLALGTWSAFAGSTSVLPGPISTDPLHARMGAKPLREGLCGPIREQIDRTMALPVNEERSIFLTATKREIIDAKNRRDCDLLCHHSFSET